MSLIVTSGRVLRSPYTPLSPFKSFDYWVCWARPLVRKPTYLHILYSFHSRCGWRSSRPPCPLMLFSEPRRIFLSSIFLVYACISCKSAIHLFYIHLLGLEWLWSVLEPSLSKRTDVFGVFRFCQEFWTCLAKTRCLWEIFVFDVFRVLAKTPKPSKTNLQFYWWSISYSVWARKMKIVLTWQREARLPPFKELFSPSSIRLCAVQSPSIHGVSDDRYLEKGNMYSQIIKYLRG
jgi:hypothetical protein